MRAFFAGLNISALGVSYNERGYDVGFMKNIRKALDAAVRTGRFIHCEVEIPIDVHYTYRHRPWSDQGFAHVKTIGGDQCGESTWKIVSDMEKDKELLDAIDIIGDFRSTSL